MTMIGSMISEWKKFNVRDMFVSVCECQLFTFSDLLVHALTKQINYENLIYCFEYQIIVIIYMCNIDKRNL